MRSTYFHKNMIILLREQKHHLDLFNERHHYPYTICCNRWPHRSSSLSPFSQKASSNHSHEKSIKIIDDISTFIFTFISRWGAKPITGGKTSPSSAQGKLPTLNFKLHTSRSISIPTRKSPNFLGKTSQEHFSSIMYIPLPRSQYIFMLIRLKKSIGMILFSKTSPYIATKLNSAYQVLMMTK